MTNTSNSFKTTNEDVYSFMLPFEVDAHREKMIWYFEVAPWWFPFAVVALYVALVFLGQRYMRNRKPYKLRGALFIWNTFLAIGTILFLFRHGSQLSYTIRHFGLHYSVCGSMEQDTSPVGQLWQHIFVYSKVLELVDTLFVILRKQPLYFLHYYHHCTVLLYCWSSFYFEQTSSGRWFAFINACVHAIMYSYYSLKSRSVRIPRVISMAITLAQMLQMVVGCFICYYMYRTKQLGLKCATSNETILLAVLMYASYLVLFIWFFYISYVHHHPQQDKTKSSSKLKQT